ncbi:MAG TPA: hypothetical protein VJ746_01305 [Nitrospira sp.]|nr:hypothetical protein [Nitrospira sp.]
MVYSARKGSDEGIESHFAKTHEALNERFRQERRSREDRISIWWIGVMMAMVFLILVFLMNRVLSSMPKNNHPTESAFYCEALPLFDVLGPDRSGSVLLPACYTAVTLLP